MKENFLSQIINQSDKLNNHINLKKEKHEILCEKLGQRSEFAADFRKLEAEV